MLKKNFFSHSWNFIFLILVPLFCFSSSIYVYSSHKTTFLQKLAQQNMKTVSWKEPREETQSLDEFIKNTLEAITNPSEQKKRRLAFEFYESLPEEYTEQDPSCLLSIKPWKELNLFKGKNSSSDYFGAVVSRNKSELGRIALFQLLSHPVANIKRIDSRQSVIKLLIENKNLFEQLQKNLETFQEHEGVFLSWWDKNPLKQSSRHSYFESILTKPLNEYSLALDAGSVYARSLRLFASTQTGLASAILLSYGILTIFNSSPKELTNQANSMRPRDLIFKQLWKPENNTFRGIVSIIAGITCGSYCYENFKRLKAHTTIESALHVLMNRVALALDAIKYCSDLLIQNPTLKNFSEFQEIINFFETQNKDLPEVQEFLELLESNELHSESSHFLLNGNTLRAYRLIKKVKNKIAPILACIGKIDAYVSLAQLYKEFESSNNTFSFAQLEESSTKPHLELIDSWLPFIDHTSAVSHSLSLGGEQPERVAIITGPNNSGKKTLLKEVACALIMAQSVGLAPAKQAILTPFATIETNFDSNKSLSSSSSMHRVNNFFDTTQKQSANQFHLFICDRILSSSSPFHAEKYSQKIVSKLKRRPNYLGLLTTHFGQTTKQAEEAEQCMNLKLSSESRSEEKYRLTKGISFDSVFFLNT